jgi:hypothetical protein
MKSAEAFYEQRDLRTVEYLGGMGLGARAVHLEIDATASRTRVGQTALLTLINLLARVHRQISVNLPEPAASLVAITPIAAATLAECVLRTAQAIDPYGSCAIGASSQQDAISCGLGPTVTGLQHYVGWEGCVGLLDREPLRASCNDAALSGAALAACLGAMAVFRTSLGMATSNRTLSVWSYQENQAAEPGPSMFAPPDVGRVLLVGAGAVAAALTYWCTTLGAGGSWTVVDQDVVALHNTNRGLVFTPRHAGWFGDNPAYKADVLATLLPNARAYSTWYDTCADLHDMEFDVVLCLANGRHVRELVANRSAPVVMQATTGATWLSELHRHIIGMDDCPACRLGAVTPLRLACSSVEIPTIAGSTDAALPFLSAASGLMLYTALQQLQAGELTARARNDWRWDFDSPHRLAASGMRRCRTECATALAPEVRQTIYGGTRWAHVDPAFRAPR